MLVHEKIKNTSTTIKQLYKQNDEKHNMHSQFSIFPILINFIVFHATTNVLLVFIDWSIILSLAFVACNAINHMQKLPQLL